MNLSHLDQKGNANMVDVHTKKDTLRSAEACATVQFSPDTYFKVKQGDNKKGDIISVSKVAGIMGAKNTSNLIPLCHPLSLSHVDLTFVFDDEKHALHITSSVTVEAKTGVEMEALTAVSIAALTVYDMCKAIDKNIIIKEIQLLSKTGGKSGTYRREEI